MARVLDDGTTQFALQHRFRSIKQDAANMLAGTCTAVNFDFTNTSITDPKTSLFHFVKSSFVLPYPLINPLRFQENIS